jgi:hypothetical protein
MVRGIQFEFIDAVMGRLLKGVPEGNPENKLDHRNLNDVIENPSVENISKWIAIRIRDELDVPVCVRVYEGPISFAQTSIGLDRA